MAIDGPDLAPADATSSPPDAEGAIEPATIDADTSPRSRLARIDAKILREIVLALALLLCYGFFQQSPAWNEYSRYDLIRALVEDGTTRIDRLADNTGDKSFYDGHYYSDKAPGSAFLGVPAYVLLTLTSRATGAGVPDPVVAVEAIAFVASGIPTVLLVILLLRFLRSIVDERWALVVSVGYGLGSIAFPFATMLFGHAASAFFLFAAFYLVARWRDDRLRWRPPLAGFLAGWAVLVEVSAMLGVLVILVYALAGPREGGRRAGLRAVVLMVAGAMIPAAMLFWYDWQSFGSPLSLGYGNLANQGFAQGMGRGILGVTWPSGSVLIDLLLGPRGLIRVAPWFLLAPFGLLAARRREVRAVVVVSAAIVVVFLAFNAGYYMPFGGWTPGPRFLLPALPFAAVLVALAPSVLRPLAVGLIALTIPIFFVATATMPNAQEMYADPLYQLWIPRLVSGDVASTIAWLRWGLPGLQPLAVLALGLVAAAAALAATFRSGAAARQFVAVVAGVLALMVVALALPLWPPSASVVSGAQSGSSGTFAVAQSGVTPEKAGDFNDEKIWAQLQNLGPAIGGTRVVFTVFTPDGAKAWSAAFGDVAWLAGERKRAAVEWDIRSVQPGDYPYAVSIESNDRSVVYLDVAHAGVVRVGP